VSSCPPPFSLSLTLSLSLSLSFSFSLFPSDPVLCLSSFVERPIVCARVCFVADLFLLWTLFNVIVHVTNE